MPDISIWEKALEKFRKKSYIGQTLPPPTNCYVDGEVVIATQTCTGAVLPFLPNQR